MSGSVRIGIDIGGTFTDLVLTDDATGEVRIAKLLTTQLDPSQAVQAGFLAAIGDSHRADEVSTVIHGTTLVTNAVVERKGARTALITTAGFRDTLEIATEHRYNMYDLNIDKPVPIVPRRLRFEVDERVFADGTVSRPLEATEVSRLAQKLRSQSVESVAVCLLHSYRNPEHERLVERVLREQLGSIPISLSSAVSPELREYQRTSTVVLNAYVQPLVDRYLLELDRKLKESGFLGRVYLMLSSGGICTLETARSYPIRLVESGPAAGALAAARLARQSGYRDVMSFDMGGTTAKACIVEGGTPATSSTFEVDRIYRFSKGSGLPLQVRSVELIEIGAGGGSIARVDNLGLLKVGPDSAGSRPGPACYGLGGAEPTVTDADLILGYLDGDSFLGGRMRLDRDAARAAIQDRVAGPLEISILEAADAIHQVVNQNMASAARIHAIERGKDPRAFPLFAFGGAGPVHAWGVARVLGADAVIVPLGAGVMSAAGLLMAPLAFDFVRSHQVVLPEVEPATIAALFTEMEADGRRILGDAGVPDTQVQVQRRCDMRYVGQGTELVVEVSAAEFTEAVLSGLRLAFDHQYHRQYGVSHPELPAEVLTWRLIASGPAPAIPVHPGRSGGGISRERPVFFRQLGQVVSTPVYNRYSLSEGEVVQGPAIIEEDESTTVVGPATTARVEPGGNLILEINR